MQDAGLDRSSLRTSATASAWLGDRLALAAVGVALASRLAIVASAFGAVHLFSAHTVHPSLREPALAERLSGTWGRLLDPFAHYDGVWFLRAAVHGYREPMTPAFFPLYPMAVRVAGEIAGHRYELAGVALSTVFFVVAVWALYRLVAAEFGPRPAFLTVVFVSVFPASFFYQAVYSESLFLLLTVACFWFLRGDRLVLAGVAAMLATLTRAAGLLLLVPMTMVYFGPGRRAAGRAWARPAALLLPLLGLVVFSGYLWRITGDPLAWATAEADWDRRPTLPTTTLWHGARSAWYAVRYLATGHWAPLADQYAGQALAFVQRELAVVSLISFLALVFAVWALATGWRRLPRTWTAYAGVSLLLPLVQARAGLPLMSLPRFVLVLFPLFVTLALATEHRRTLRTVLLVVSIAGLVFLTGRFALWLFVA